MLDERIHDFKIENPNFVNKKHASRIIEQLLKCPKKPQFVTPISEKQISFINLCMQTRENASQIIDSYCTYRNVDVIYKLNKDNATELIGMLKNLPYMQRQEIEVGAYKMNETYYSVRKGRESGRNHAYAFDFETKSWQFARGVVYQLKPEMRLTLSEASSFGILTGTCVHCGATLTQRKSVVAGMGRVCASKYRN